jgi:hypothetical protein
MGQLVGSQRRLLLRFLVRNLTSSPGDTHRAGAKRQNRKPEDEGCAVGRDGAVPSEADVPSFDELACRSIHGGPRARGPVRARARATDDALAS